MTDNLRLVSIIIPCRNEERFIGKCLDSIIAQDYPKDYIEVIVVDGMSEDETMLIVQEYIQRYPFIRLLDNYKKIIPAAMNIGIENAKGKIIMKIDSHAVYASDYISKCVRFLNEYNADNVGGVIVAIPRRNTFFGRAIALSLSNSFGVGNSFFRIGVEEPTWADTVFSGCYKREVFDRVGLYNENIVRSEDVAINSRLRRMGGKILLVPEIVSYYYARSKFSEFCKHNFDNGIWITYPLKYGRVLFSWRHLVPFAFVLSLMTSATLSIFSQILLWTFLFISGSYTLANIYFSIRISIKEKDLRYLFAMPLIFTALHIGYGIGSLWGLLKIIVSVRLWKKRFSSSSLKKGG